MGKTILLVDDEVEITDIHQRYLVQAGYQVLVAHDGVEALEIFKRKAIDLIITDIMMPRMDGYDLISEVQYQSRISLFSLSRLKPVSRIKFTA